MAEPATVTGVSPLYVQLHSSSDAVPALHLASYTPVVADQVSVVRQGSQILVLGRFA